MTSIIGRGSEADECPRECTGYATIWRIMMKKPIIKVEVKCHGYGVQYWGTVELTKEDIEQLAVEKMKERDSSPNIDPISVEFCIGA